MKVQFQFEGKNVSSDVLINPNMPKLHFVVRALEVDGVDLYNSDEDEDIQLSDQVVYSAEMQAAVYNQLAA